MNTLGKILVFFVMVLSLIWNYLVVNAYATRTNYKTELEKTQKLYAEAAKSAQNSAKLAEEQRAAADSTISQLSAEITSLRARVQAAENDSAGYKAKVEEIGKDKEGYVTAAQLQQTGIKTLQSQVDVLRGQVNDLDKKLNDATIAEQKAENEKLQARIERDAANRKSDDYEKRLLDLNDKYFDLQNGGRGGGGSRVPPTDPDFRATVTAATGERVEISLGGNAGLQKGAVLDVSRPSAKKYLGKLTIERVDPFGATGRFTPLAGVGRAAAADLPQKGDVVSVIK
jgi:predicted  nucleic acid-binding Zn-ribbon protein